MSVYLVWDSVSFGAQFKRSGHDTVRARYDTVEEAKIQGDHDHASNESSPDRKPLRIEDEDGNALYAWE